MRLARQQFQHSEGIIPIFRLAQNFVTDDDHRIGSDKQEIGRQLRNFESLRLLQAQEHWHFIGWQNLDPKDPYRSLAEKLLTTGFLDPALRIDYVKQAVDAMKLTGCVLYTHGFGRCSLADRAFSKHLRSALEEKGVPLLTLEGDCMDASIDPCSTVTKIASFVEALNLKRYGNIFGKIGS